VCIVPRFAGNWLETQDRWGTSTKRLNNAPTCDIGCTADRVNSNERSRRDLPVRACDSAGRPTKSRAARGERFRAVRKATCHGRRSTIGSRVKGLVGETGGIFCGSVGRGEDDRKTLVGCQAPCRSRGGRVLSTAASGSAIERATRSSAGVAVVA
jgi:hypothetical protein